MECSFRVEGQVQGVGFRWWTQALGRQLELRGWVRNEADGSVEIHAGGPEGSVREFQRQLHAGPRGAKVERVTEVGPAQERPASGFEIRWG